MSSFLYWIQKMVCFCPYQCKDKSDILFKKSVIEHSCVIRIFFAFLDSHVTDLVVKSVTEAYTHSQHCFIFPPPVYFFIYQCFTSPCPPSLLFCVSVSVFCSSLTTPVMLWEAGSLHPLRPFQSDQQIWISAFQQILWKQPATLSVCNCLSLSTWAFICLCLSLFALCHFLLIKSVHY